MSFNTIIDWNGCSAEQQQQLLMRPAISASESISRTVSEILNNVKDNGDAALREYSAKFDKTDVKALKVSDEEIAAAGARRDDLFLTTKVWVDKYAKGPFAASVDESLDKLGVDQVDLLLLHWPADKVPVAQQVALINEVQAAGRTRFIGVSNQNASQLRESVAVSPAPIVTNQIELHPYIDNAKVVAAARELGVAITAYYAMADGAVPKDALLQKIGAAYGKTAAQVALRWLIQQGFVALSKTANPGRVAENFDVFDFTLTADDMAAIAGLRRPDGRIVSPDGLAPDWNA